MSGPGPNIHGTAVVIATTGLLFVGPSGAGKSTLAHACLCEAAQRGLFARLVADDQIFVTHRHGQVIAHRPEAIRDRIELRGTGLAVVSSLDRARLDYAVMAGSPAVLERLPPEEESFEILPGILLPLVRVAATAPDPLDRLAHFIPFLGLSNENSAF